jgi:hypothetical protein
MVVMTSKYDKFPIGVRHAMQPAAANGSLNHYLSAHSLRTVLSLLNNNNNNNNNNNIW